MWAIKDGQQYATPLNYAPLSDDAAAKSEKLIRSITFRALAGKLAVATAEAASVPDHPERSDEGAQSGISFGVSPARSLRSARKLAQFTLSLRMGSG